MAQQLRERIDKWDYMKLKSFCTTKEINGHQIEEAVHRMGENPWELCKGLITRIFRELKKLNFPNQ
jgi:hypothetical protein